MLRQLGFIKLSRDKNAPKKGLRGKPKPVFSKPGLNIKAVKNPAFNSTVSNLLEKVDRYKKYTSLLRNEFTSVYDRGNSKLDIKIPVKDLKR